MKRALYFILLSTLLIACKSKQELKTEENRYLQYYIVELKEGVMPKYIKQRYHMYEYVDVRNSNKTLNEYNFSFNVTENEELKLFYHFNADEKIVKVMIPGKEIKIPSNTKSEAWGGSRKVLKQ